jgi:hypothetical protein
MAGERTFLVRILGNSDSAVTAFKKLGREGSDALSTVFDVAKKGALIATAAAGAIGAAAFSAIKAATDDQASQKNLADQLRRTMEATDEQIASVEQYISKQQMLVGVADDQLRPALANLARATGDITFAQKNLGLALDISAATGIELETVSLALGKAFNGNIGALTKLGVPIDENVKKSKDLSSVVDTLNTQFGGAAAAAADTFAGRLDILKLSIGEAWEGIGYALLPIAEKLVAFIQKNVVPVIQAFADELSGGGSLRDALLAATAEAGEFGLRVVDMVQTVVESVGQIANVFIDLVKPIIFAGGALVSMIAFVRGGKGAFDDVGLAVNNFVSGLDNLKTNTAVTGAAFDRFRNDVLGVAAAATVTQEQLRNLDQTQRGIAAGGPVQKFIGPMLAGYGSLAGKTKTAAELQADYNKQLEALQRAGGGASKTIETAKQKFEKYTDALKSSTSAQKAFTNAQKASDKAATSLMDAQNDVRKKQKALNDAVNGYGADSDQAKKAQRELAAAQRNVAQAGFRVEESVFAVTDAEKKLADLRKDPQATPQEIRQAEIDLAQAKLAVADATDSEFEATMKLKDAQLLLNEAVSGAIEGSETYLGFAKDLEDAQRKAFDASERLTDAKDRETEAYENLAEAIKKATDAAIIANQPTTNIPKLPGVVTPTSTSTTFGGQADPSVQIVVNTGIGTNGVEAGRQIVQLLQQYTAVDAFAIDRLGFAPRR